MKKLKKMPRIEGVVPRFYDKSVIIDMCIVINKLASAIDNISKRVEKIEEMEEINNAE